VSQAKNGFTELLQMSLWAKKAGIDDTLKGVLFRKPALRMRLSPALPETGIKEESRSTFSAAYKGMYLIMLLVFIRPHEVMPEIFGALPLVKIAAVGTILFYVVSRYNAGEKLIVWSLELKMMLIMGVMGMLLTPIAASPGDSIDVLKDTFITLLLLFVLMTSLIDTRYRLRSFLFAMVISGFLYAVSAMKTFLTRGNDEVERIKGWGTQLQNPNDLACVLDLLLPFAVFFVFTGKGKVRLLALMTVIATVFSVMFTFSRSGFLGLLLALFVIVWKVGRRYRLRIVIGTAVLSAVLVVAMPGAYRTRLMTIFNPQTDQTNSAQERQLLMRLAADLAVRRSIIGLGIGNFHIYSFHEKVAHNSFLEITAELGVIGLIAYLVFILGPFLVLRRIERETLRDGPRPDRELNILSICFQASLAAYIIYGFFGSVQYYPYLYFIVAYVVAFRRIFSMEKVEAVGGIVGMPALNSLIPVPKGALWKQQRLRGIN
jgi:O-antigen ligase